MQEAVGKALAELPLQVRVTQAHAHMDPLTHTHTHAPWRCRLLTRRPGTCRPTSTPGCGCSPGAQRRPSPHPPALQPQRHPARCGGGVGGGVQVGKAVLCAMLCPRACVHARCRAVGIMWEGSRGGQGGAVCTPRPAARARAPTAQQAQQRADQPTAQQRGPRAKSRPRRPRVRGSGRGPGGPRAHLYSRTLNTSCSALSHTASARSVPSCEKAALQQPPGAVASFLNSALGTCAGGGPCVTRRMRVRVRGGRRSRVWGATGLNHPLPFREVARCVGVCLERWGEVGGGAF